LISAIFKNLLIGNNMLMSELIKDFLSGGIITALITSLAYNFTGDKAISYLGFLYGGPILFLYLVYKIGHENGMKSALLFSKFSLIGLLASMLMIAPWLYATKKNMKTLTVFSALYMLVIYLVLFPIYGFLY
tara:strand:+ start:3042 stop:3437 length:396 start_codon:yes stop_codon:yes gene_type:complete